MTTALTDFDFGRGPTQLDRFVRFVLTAYPQDDRYQDARRFTPYAWSCAYQVWANTENRNGSLIYTGTTVIPVWLQEVTKTSAWVDPQLGGPTLMTADPSNVDWFELASEHPQDIVLSVDFEEAPALSQIRSALSLAQAAGVEYRLGVVISPATELGGALQVCLDYFVLIGTERTSSVVIDTQEALDGVLPDDTSQHPHSQGKEAWSWEWMSCWPSKV